LGIVVSQLANLFVDLRLREDPAVTPSLELAKLALVTSKDEEEDDARERAERPETNSSASTDKTLVDDAAPEPSGSSGSVLGKRLRRTQSAMSIDSVTGVAGDDPDPNAEADAADGFVVIGRSTEGTGQSQEMDTSEEGKERRVPPPLPPRKKSTLEDSGMMFGKSPGEFQDGVPDTHTSCREAARRL
jgi:ubiquitin carboxyl-terminal hydrolase 25/28